MPDNTPAALPQIDLALVKEILTMVAPAIDLIVAATPTPFDNAAWMVIKRLLLKPATTLAVYDQLVAKGTAPQLSTEVRAMAMAAPE